MRSAKAVDGQHGGDDDFYTKWFPNGMSPQWITVDLGALHDVTGTEWFPALEDIKDETPYRYKIECSRDGQTWETYQDCSQNAEFQKSYACRKPANARYLKLTIQPYPGLEGNAARPKIAEFKIFGGT